MNLAVIFGGPSPEHDISILTGLQAARELSSSGHDVSCLYWSKDADWYLVPTNSEGSDFVSGAPKSAEALRLISGEGFVTGSKLRSKSIDVEAVIVCCHGVPGEDGTLQSLLDVSGIPYSGPSVAGAAIGMDKLAFYGCAVVSGVPSLPRVLVSEDISPEFAAPYIVKPRFGGSSIGVEVAADWTTAKALVAVSPHYARGAIVEPYRSDLVDLNIAVRTYPSFQYSAIERPLKNSHQILSYKDKYIGGEGFASAPRELPADIPEKVADEIRAYAKTVAEFSMVRGISRIDFLWNDSELYVNEINTIPGSLSKYLWVDPKIPFAQLLSDLAAEAINTPAHKYITTGSDGFALRSAGSIASKLD